MNVHKNMHKRKSLAYSIIINIVIKWNIPVLVADHHSVTGDLTTLTIKFCNGVCLKIPISISTCDEIFLLTSSFSSIIKNLS